MNLEDFLARIGIPMNPPAGATPRPSGHPRSLPPSAKMGIRATPARGRIVVGAGKIPFWKMKGYHLVDSGLPGVRTWRGSLSTQYGQVIAEIESAHPGQYAIYIVNLPSRLHGHPCLPKSGKRWHMHVHGSFQGLDHVIFAAEKELERHWRDYEPPNREKEDSDERISL